MPTPYESTLAGDEFASALAADMDSEHEVSQIEAPTRLVDYLKARLIAVPGREVGTLITSGFVRIRHNGNDTTGRTYDLLTPGDRIGVASPALAALKTSGRWITPWSTTLRVHHEDEDLLVVEKAAGVHVHPLGAHRAATLLGALIFHAGARTNRPWGGWRPHIVQRLDRPTAGLLLVAKGPMMKDALVRLQQRGGLRRRYRAMVLGNVREAAGIIDDPLGRDPCCDYRRGRLSTECGGQSAVTCWSVVQRSEDRTLLDIEPLSGRTHQIRAHLAGIGHSIVGDRLYSSRYSTAAEGTDDAARMRQESSLPGQAASTAIALRAVELAFRHPRSDEQLSFRSPPTAEFGR